MGYYADAAAAAIGDIGNVVSSGVVASTASFTTTSATLVNVTNPADLTLSGLTAANTYTIIVIAKGTVASSAAGEAKRVIIQIDGTDDDQENPEDAGGATSSNFWASTFARTGITGVTSLIVRLRARITGGATLTLQNCQVVAFAVRTA